MHNPEDILDLCIEALRAGRDPEDVLRKHPDQADEIRPLLQLLPEFEALPRPEPTVAGLMRTMARLTAGTSVRDRGGKPRGVLTFARTVMTRVAAAVAIVLFTGWSLSAASSDALPGDFLYPIKLFTERVRFHLALNPTDKAELRIVFSEKRLIEALRQHRQGDGIDRALLQAMLDEAQKALDETKRLPEPTRDLLHSRIASVWEFQGKTLEAISKKATPKEQETLQPFMQKCRERCGWMRRQTGENRGGRQTDVTPDSPAKASGSGAGWPREDSCW